MVRLFIWIWRLVFTDMIAEAVVSWKLETTGHEILKAQYIRTQPWVKLFMEAVARSYDESDSLIKHKNFKNEKNACVSDAAFFYKNTLKKQAAPSNFFQLKS